MNIKSKFSIVRNYICKLVKIDKIVSKRVDLILLSISFSLGRIIFFRYFSMFEHINVAFDDFLSSNSSLQNKTYLMTISFINSSDASRIALILHLRYIIIYIESTYIHAIKSSIISLLKTKKTSLINTVRNCLNRFLN